MPTRLHAVSAAILAGGRSSRFVIGDTAHNKTSHDKAMHVWRGKPLLQHVADALAGATDRFVVGGDALRYAQFGLPVHADRTPFLGGLHALARAILLAQHDHVIVTACDMPLVPSAYWQWLATRAIKNTNLKNTSFVPQNAHGQLEPFAGLYHKSILPVLQAHIQNHKLGLQAALANPACQNVPWEETQARFDANIFLNANRPEDLP